MLKEVFSDNVIAGACVFEQRKLFSDDQEETEDDRLTCDCKN